MLIDSASIKLIAGRGGNGVVGFRKDTAQSSRGPDGGNGGRGGNVIFKANHNLNSLYKYRSKIEYKAASGGDGSRQRKAGKGGEDLFLYVPVNTQIFIDDKLHFDLNEDGMEYVMVKGGRGGFGNSHFISSTRQAPRFSELGEPGQEQELRLELKMSANVGLLGLPNAGKSSLVAKLTNATPKIADYAFTTLEPSLGIVDHHERSFSIADIPGIIEGASEGKGLGIKFLKHLERTGILVHLIGLDNPDQSLDELEEKYHVINNEVESYSKELSIKDKLVVINKVDIIEEKRIEGVVKSLGKKLNTNVMAISTISGYGIDELLNELLIRIDKYNVLQEEIQEEEKSIKKITVKDDPRLYTIERKEEGWFIYGEQIEKFAIRTNYEQREGVHRLKDILEKRGILKDLKSRGLEYGDNIIIASKSFEY